MTLLSVNLNKVALLRNARHNGIPSVIKAARVSIAAGAAGITVHPRPDMRHICPEDVDDLAALLAAEYPEVEFNIEGNPFEGAAGEYPGFMALLRRVRPAQATLVPDSTEQLTSDHGWSLAASRERLAPVVAELKSLGIRVSLFMDADSEELPLAAELGADRIELYTERYADHFATPEEQQVFQQYRHAALQAQSLGLGVNAGHDLNLDNLPLLASIDNLKEVSIGHALIADALLMGLEQTVKAYVKALKRQS